MTSLSVFCFSGGPSSRMDCWRWSGPAGQREGIGSQLQGPRKSQGNSLVVGSGWSNTPWLPTHGGEQAEPWPTAPAIAIVHPGTNNIGYDDACRCRIAMDNALRTPRVGMPNTHIAGSTIILRLSYYSPRLVPIS